MHARRRGNLGGERAVTLVNMHFAPEVVATAQHLTDLVEHLVEDGCAVHVLTSRSRTYRLNGEEPERELRGVTVRRLPLPFPESRALSLRLLNYLAFLVQALVALLVQRARTPIVVLTTPPMLELVGALAAMLRRVPLDVWSMDLHPDVERAAGVVAPRGFTDSIVEGLHAAALRRARTVVVLGEYMRAHVLAKGVSPDRVHVVPIWAPAEVTTATPDAVAASRVLLGVREDALLLLYAGNMGIPHRFHELIALAEAVRDEPRVQFVFAGGGERRGWVEQEVARRGLSNVRFASYVPRSEIAARLAAADIHLVTLADPFAGLCVPSKAVASAAAGKPIVFLGPAESETAALVRDADCGLHLPTGDATAIARAADALRGFVHDRAELARLGLQGARYYWTHLNRSRACERLVGLFAGAARDDDGVPACAPVRLPGGAATGVLGGIAGARRGEAAALRGEVGAD